MNFLQETALLYDGISFGAWYFNREKTEERTIVPCADPGALRRSFEEIAEKAGVLPPLLEPFFHMNDSGVSPLASLLAEREPDCTAASFFDDLQKDPEGVREALCKCFFRMSAARCRSLFSAPDGESDDPTARFLAEVEKMNVSPALKLQFSLLTGSLSYGISLLRRTFLSLQEVLKEIRERERRLFDREQENILISLRSGLYDGFLPASEKTASAEDAGDPDAVLLYLSPEEITVRRRKEGGTPVLFLGVKHDEMLAAAAAEGESADAFLVTCGSETRVRIIHMLMEDGELTVSDLARRLNSPVTTLLKHVEGLYAGKVIYISRRAGLKIYYRLNPAYFREVRASVNELFRQILFESEK